MVFSSWNEKCSTIKLIDIYRSYMSLSIRTSAKANKFYIKMNKLKKSENWLRWCILPMLSIKYENAFSLFSYKYTFWNVMQFTTRFHTQISDIWLRAKKIIQLISSVKCLNPMFSKLMCRQYIISFIDQNWEE